MIDGEKYKFEIDEKSDLGSGKNGKVKEGKLIFGENKEKNCKVAIKEYKAEHFSVAL